MSYERIDTEPFVNPYNFVSRPEGEVKRGAVSNNAGKTGKLHCRIATKTPLAVPDTYYDEEANEHKSYAFNTIAGKKAIPGSSIRGCIRSVYETLTDSCFVTMRENEYITNRVEAGRAYKPGLLIRGEEGWKLFSANRLLVKVEETGKSEATLFSENVMKNEEGVLERYIEYDKENYFFGDFVSVKSKFVDRRAFVTNLKKTNKSDYILYVGEPLKDLKKYQSVFRKRDEVSIAKEIINSALNLLDFIANMYKDEAINKSENHYGYGGYERARDRGVIPIWYSWDENTKNLSVSLAAIGRKVYDKSVNNLSRGRGPCEDRENVCPACALFGMAKGNGIGSKLRFSDAFITKEGSSSYVTLKELGSPRTGYYLFYSANGVDFDNPGASISGRKFYYHIPEASTKKEIYGQDEKTKRNATVEILKDSEFEFDVYFDNISDQELSELKFALTFGDKKDGPLCHKIGHGKPIGLGSVKITIESQTIRKFDESGYFAKPESDVDLSCSSSRFSKSAKEELLKMSNFYAMKEENVCYPYVLGEAGNDENLVANHQWFTKNRECARTHTEHQLLEKPTNDSQRLYPYKYIPDPSKADSRKNSKTEEKVINQESIQKNAHDPKMDFEMGKKYNGTLTAWKGKWAQIKLEDGRNTTIFDEEPHKYSVNQSLTLVYRGKTKDGKHDSWFVKGKKNAGKS